MQAEQDIPNDLGLVPKMDVVKVEIDADPDEDSDTPPVTVRHERKEAPDYELLPHMLSSMLREIILIREISDSDKEFLANLKKEMNSLIESVLANDIVPMKQDYEFFVPSNIDTVTQGLQMARELGPFIVKHSRFFSIRVLQAHSYISREEFVQRAEIDPDWLEENDEFIKFKPGLMMFEKNYVRTPNGRLELGPFFRAVKLDVAEEKMWSTVSKMVKRRTLFVPLDDQLNPMSEAQFQKKRLKNMDTLLKWQDYLYKDIRVCLKCKEIIPKFNRAMLMSRGQHSTITKDLLLYCFDCEDTIMNYDKIELAHLMAAAFHMGVYDPYDAYMTNLELRMPRRAAKRIKHTNTYKLRQRQPIRYF